MEKKFLTAPVSSDFYQTVRVAAAIQGVSMAEFVRRVLTEFIKSQTTTRTDNNQHKGMRNEDHQTNN